MNRMGKRGGGNLDSNMRTLFSFPLTASWNLHHNQGPPAHLRFDSLRSLCQWVYTSSCTEISRMYHSPIAAALRYHDYRSIISYHGGGSIMKYIRYMESLFPLSAHTCTQHNDTAPDIKTLPHPLRPRTYLRSQVIHKTSNENNPT